jgi:hypothetical protein
VDLFSRQLKEIVSRYHSSAVFAPTESKEYED